MQWKVIGKLENNSESGNYAIFSDTKIALLALKANTSNSVMVTEIQLLLY